MRGLLTDAESFDGKKCGKIGDNSCEIHHAIAVIQKESTMSVQVVVQLKYAKKELDLSRAREQFVIE